MLYNAETIGEGLRTTPIQTVRVSALVRNDRYIKQGVRYRVLYIEHRRIYYTLLSENGQRVKGFISANSQERVEIIR